jgi:hypothetical protein
MQMQRGSLDSVGGGGRTYFQQRPDVATSFSQNSLGMDPTQFAQQHFQNFGQFEGSSDPSKQFFQPVYQPQYQNFNMGNPMSISQYGQQPSFGSGFGGGFMPQMQTPFQQPMQQQFNPYTNNFGGGFGNGFGGGFGGGFMPQQQFQQPMQQFMPQQQFQPQMQTPFSYQQPQQYNPYQMQSPFSYQQPSYGGMGRNNFTPDAPLPEGMMGTMGGRGYDPVTGRMDLGTAGGSGQFMPQQPMQQPQSPFRSSGPRQAIVGRSSQMRGTPNVMRRAAGGITSLMDEA